MGARAQARTMLAVVEELMSVMAEMFSSGGGSIHEQQHMRANEIRALLSGMPVDVLDRMYEAERRVEKMERALLMLDSGLRAQQMPEATWMPIMKAIKNALR